MKLGIMASAFFCVFISVTGCDRSNRHTIQLDPPKNEKQRLCFDPTELAEIRAELNLPEDFSEAAICDPTSESAILYETLKIMKNLRITPSAVKSPFDQGILPNNFWEYFTKDGTDLFNQRTPGSCTGVIAFTLGALRDGKIYLCETFYKSDTSMIERISVLLHEVRHFNGHPHTTCENAPGKGKNSCDQSIEARGSYAVSIESLAKMAVDTVNFTAKDRAYAKNLVLQLSQIVFNEPIKADNGTTMGIYLVNTKDNTAVMFDGAKAHPVQAIQDGFPISRKLTLSVFPNDKSDVYTIDFLSGNEIFPGYGITSKTYNGLTKDLRPDIVDILVKPNYQAQIDRNKVEIDNRVVDTTWNIETTISADEMGDTDLDALYLLDDQQNLHKATWKSGQLEIVDLPNPHPELIQIIILNGLRLALSTSGDILVFSSGPDATWVPFEPLAGQKFTRMTRPFSWHSSLMTE